ncbi:MAG: hypothetical protein AAGF97_06140 [Planctomycetota bacterium]
MRCLVLIGLIVMAASAWADVNRSPEAEQVELFAAIDAEQIEVKLIPKDSTQSTVIIQNNTENPLTIEIPGAFAGVPVLAQVGGGGGGFQVGGGGGGGQGFGGGGGGLGGGGAGGGGVFSVAPEAVGKFKVTTVCLEHGKDEPRPRMAYKMVPIEEFTDDQRVIELVTMLGDGELDQQVAQAAAWHLTDALSWDELLAKVKVKHLNGSREYYFNRDQIAMAVSAVREAVQRAGDEAPAPKQKSTQAYDRLRSAAE